MVVSSLQIFTSRFFVLFLTATFLTSLSEMTCKSYGMAKNVPSYKSRPITEDVIYFLMVDRFADGDPSNNRGSFTKADPKAPDLDRDILEHGYWPENKGYYLGGDFKGLTSRLDYLKDMGITALWLSPILKNQAVQVLGSLAESHSGYHGYWITDFTTVDPHLGTEEDFRNFLTEAHKRNMKVFMDIIVNHTADIIRYKECGDCKYRNMADFPYRQEKANPPINPQFNPEKDGWDAYQNLVNPNYAYTPYVPENLKNIKVPSWLNDPIYYHNRGNSTFSGENSQLGDFYGLDDLFTEHPQVIQGMLDVYKDFMTRFEIDGFRMDTVKHVNIEFWQKFVPEIIQHAKTLKRPQFYVFGEVYASDPQILAYYTRNGKMEATLDFALQAAIKSTVAEGKGREAFEKVHDFDDVYRINTSPQKLPTFASNHDMGRIGYFLQSSYPHASADHLLKRAMLAQSLLFFSRGVPVIYYGDEQGFTGDGGDKDAREPMFPSQVASYNDNVLIGTNKTTAVSNFDAEHPIYQAIQHYAKIYQEHPTLRRGEQVLLNKLSNNEKVYGFLRVGQAEHDDYLVTYNFDEKPQTINWKRPTVQLVYASHLEKDDSIENISQGDGSYEIPALSFLILKGSKSTAAKLATLGLSQRAKTQNISIHSPQENDLVSGLVRFAVDTPSQFSTNPGDFLVKFFYKKQQEKAWRTLYSDPTPPFQGFLDTSFVEQGEKIEVKAELHYRQSEEVIGEATRTVWIDSRQPVVNLHYENGNKRTLAYYQSPEGNLSVLKKITEGQAFQIPWPKQAESISVFFADKKGKNLRFDQPLNIKFDEHVKDKLVSNKQSLHADIFVNNLGKVEGVKNWVGNKIKPATLAANARKTRTQIKDTLYVRGGMNTWEAKDSLNYLGQGTYQSDINLPSGIVEFKIADAQWSGPRNFGSPIHQDTGLTASSQSGNLSITIPSGKQGKYRLMFIHLPSDNTKKKDLSLVTIEPIKP